MSKYSEREHRGTLSAKRTNWLSLTGDIGYLQLWRAFCVEIMRLAWEQKDQLKEHYELLEASQNK